MAATNLLFKYYNNGPKSSYSAGLELMLKQVVLTHNGADVGAIASTDASGDFYFNNKKLKSTAVPTADADLTNKLYVDTGLGTKVDSSLVGANSGVATLNASGKLTAAQVPSIAITDTFVVATQAAMLALSTAETGDVAIRTDEVKSYILKGTDPSVLADWEWLQTPASPVLSVNSQTGVIVLDTDDIAEGNNKYFTAAAGKAAVQEETLTNAEGAEITIRQFGIRSAGSFVLAQAADAAITEGVEFYCVKDATIAIAASGVFYKKGALIPGFTALTVDAVVYLSRTVNGGYVQSMAGFVAGERVVKLGVARSATEIEFDPELLFEIV